MCEESGKRIKKLVYDVIYKTQSHHIGCIASCLDILAALYFGVMNIDPADPQMQTRDRFILSKGHAALGQYATLAIRGYFPERILDGFGKDGTLIGGHPDKECLPGIEASTGSLGHGLSMGAGAALAAKKDMLPSRFFVLMSDGECDEGSVWEAVMFVAHHALDNLILIIDKNDFQAFGATSAVLNLDPLAEKFELFGWTAKEVDGHDIPALISVLNAAREAHGRPTVILARTVKGKGIRSLENTLESHYASLDDAQYAEAISQLRT